MTTTPPRTHIAAAIATAASAYGLSEAALHFNRHNQNRLATGARWAVITAMRSLGCLVSDIASAVGVAPATVYAGYSWEPPPTIPGLLHDVIAALTTGRAKQYKLTSRPPLTHARLQAMAKTAAEYYGVLDPDRLLEGGRLPESHHASARYAIWWALVRLGYPTARIAAATGAAHSTVKDFRASHRSETIPPELIGRLQEALRESRAITARPVKAGAQRFIFSPPVHQGPIPLPTRQQRDVVREFEQQQQRLADLRAKTAAWESGERYFGPT